MVTCPWGLGGTELGEDEGWDAGSQMQLLAESRGAEAFGNPSTCLMFTISEGLHVAFYVREM